MPPSRRATDRQPRQRAVGLVRLTGRNDARCTGRYVIRRTRAALCHQAPVPAAPGPSPCAVVFVDRPPSQLPNVCRSSPRRAVSGRTRAGPDAPPERHRGGRRTARQQPGREGQTAGMPRTGGHYISMPGRVCATAAPARPTGRSRGETLALRWSDFDLTNSILRVRGTLSRANGNLVISEPRTERSHRNVPLSPATAGLLGGSRPAKQSSGSRRPRSGLRRASSSPRGAGQQPTLGGALRAIRGSQGFGNERCRSAHAVALISRAHARGGRATAYRRAAVSTDDALLRPAALGSNGLARTCAVATPMATRQQRGRLGFWGLQA
jgi:hypothetical protein